MRTNTRTVDEQNHFDIHYLNAFNSVNGVTNQQENDSLAAINGPYFSECKGNVYKMLNRHQVPLFWPILKGNHHVNSINIEKTERKLYKNHTLKYY